MKTFFANQKFKFKLFFEINEKKFKFKLLSLPKSEICNQKFKIKLFSFCFQKKFKFKLLMCKKKLNLNFCFAEFEALKRAEAVSRPQILQKKS